MVNLRVEIHSTVLGIDEEMLPIVVIEKELVEIVVDFAVQAGIDVDRVYLEQLVARLARLLSEL
jgi:hypothetical protein